MLALLAIVNLVAPTPIAVQTPVADPPSSRRPELTDDERFLVAKARAADARTHLRSLTATPHMAGTPADRETALYVESVLEQAGFETEIREYRVLLSYPRAVGLRLTAPTALALDPLEKPAEPDPDSFDEDAVLPFLAYSASGDAEGEVVYAHYGRVEDFELLEAQEITIAGRICLMRYGKTFRGLKVYEAQRRGAIGVLLYPDPDDDGYRKGDTHPDGPWRPKTAVQRGSLLFLSHLVGDPLTPGVAARDGAKRLARDECPWLPTIPCLPISWQNAQAILGEVGGRTVPANTKEGRTSTFMSSNRRASARYRDCFSSPSTYRMRGSPRTSTTPFVTLFSGLVSRAPETTASNS